LLLTTSMFVGDKARGMSGRRGFAWWALEYPFIETQRV
jgi:hypothetical protein